MVFPAVPGSVKGSPNGHRPGAWSGLLRIPAQAIHRRIIRELNAAGFDELREPHMAMLQFPGPDGVRPSALVERAGMSKHAMNQLLRSLEDFGYVARSDAPDEGRARIVCFTSRGRAAYSKIHDILRDIEHERCGLSLTLGFDSKRTRAEVARAKEAGVESFDIHRPFGASCRSIPPVVERNRNKIDP